MNREPKKIIYPLTLFLIKIWEYKISKKDLKYIQGQPTMTSNKNITKTNLYLKFEMFKLSNFSSLRSSLYFHL